MQHEKLGLTIVGLSGRVFLVEKLMHAQTKNRLTYTALSDASAASAVAAGTTVIERNVHNAEVQFRVESRILYCVLARDQAHQQRAWQ